MRISAVVAVDSWPSKCEAIGDGKGLNKLEQTNRPDQT
jgi:hypothetical protein